MKNVIIVIAAILLVAWLAKRFIPSGEDLQREKAATVATMRLNAMLQGWKEGGTSGSAAEQTAICQWAQGRDFIADRDELEQAVSDFDRWRREKNLYGALQSYEVVKTTRKESSDGPYTLAELRLNGQSHFVGVPHDKKAIFWTTAEGR
jgi:hypothetical protein